MMKCMKQGRRGFTLIELLVVMSIIALLIAILLPVLGVARAEGESLVELAAGRSLQSAHLGQSYDNRGLLLPGVGGGGGRNHLGNPVGGLEGRRYPWRLASYLEGNLAGTLLFNGSEAILSSGSEAAVNYSVSIAPGLGYNAQYLGGLAGSDADLAVKQIDAVKTPSRLIAFGSAHRKAIEATVLNRNVGHEQIFAPTGVRSLGFAPQTAWDDGYDIDADSSAAHGFVHARHNGAAIFTFLDGHAERLVPEDVRDMQLWSNQAQLASDPDWTP